MNELEQVEELLSQAYEKIGGHLELKYGQDEDESANDPLTEVQGHIEEALDSLRYIEGPRVPDYDDELPDIAEFQPVYKGTGQYDNMCFTTEELQAAGIPEDRWWTLLSTEDGNIIWSHGFHYVNRANGRESYIHTRVVPPEGVCEAQAYIHEEEAA
ncbi:MAG TPA: hypothetical protein PKZ76_17575 [Xanthomonadaceae bacterium]|nr:hypothetical protein [Xanthomonadaceae bacterium]